MTITVVYRGKYDVKSRREHGTKFNFGDKYNELLSVWLAKYCYGICREVRFSGYHARARAVLLGCQGGQVRKWDLRKDIIYREQMWTWEPRVTGLASGKHAMCDFDERRDQDFLTEKIFGCRRAGCRKQASTYAMQWTMRWAIHRSICAHVSHLVTWKYLHAQVLYCISLRQECILYIEVVKGTSRDAKNHFPCRSSLALVIFGLGTCTLAWFHSCSGYGRVTCRLFAHHAYPDGCTDWAYYYY